MKLFFKIPKIVTLTFILVSFLNIIELKAYDFDSDGLFYNIIDYDKLEVEVTYENKTYNSYKGDIIIPDKVSFNGKEYLTTQIGPEAFMGCKSLTNIQLPKNLNKICYDAFAGCNILKEINIPNGVTIIEIGTFRGCTNLEKVELPYFITEISNVLFYNCTSLDRIIIPNSVTIIQPLAFYGCVKLSKIEIPDSVKIIEDSAFYGCTSLFEVKLGENIEEIRPLAFMNCESLTEILLPDSINYIGYNVFSGCSSLEHISLPKNLNEILSQTFLNCINLTKIKLPESISYIDMLAFEGCNKLVSIEISNNNKKYTSLNGVLYDKEITEIICISPGISRITIPITISKTNHITDVLGLCYNLDSIFVEEGNPFFKSIDGILYNKDITTLLSFPCARNKINFPNTVIEIGAQSFLNCRKLDALIIPNSIQYIGSAAFLNSEIREIILPNSLVRIEDCTFMNCSKLKSITIPELVDWLGDWAFYGCESLKDIKLNNLIEEIGDMTFGNCISLEEIELPKSIKRIYGWAFEKCRFINKIICNSPNPPKAETKSFQSISKSNCRLYVPEEAIEIYSNTSPWSEFLNIMPMEQTMVKYLNDDSSEITVYTLKGIKIMQTNNKEDMKSLKKGFYIVNGNKIFLKPYN